MDSNDRLKLNELIVASIDNDITPEQFEQLKAFLRDDTDAQAYYSKIISLFVVLKENRAVLSEQNVDDEISEFFQGIINDGLAVPAIRDEMILDPSDIREPAKESEATNRRHVDRRSFFRNVAKFAAVLLIFASIVFVDSWLKNNRSANNGSHYLGKLTRTVDAQWSNVSGPIEIGSELYAGPMSLEHGLAEIVLSNGAEVLIEGPCDFKLESESQIFLDSGSLVANIKNSLVKRLVVRTDNATIVDYGTEFGVLVDRLGNTTTQVFQGCVELRQGSDPIKYDKALRLEKNQGGQVNPYGNVYNVEYDRWTFIRKEQFDSEIKAAEGSSYHRWKSYSYKLRRNADLVAYYTFENAGSGQLANLACSTLNKYSGTPESLIQNGTLPEPVQGRWPEKNALYFDAAYQQYITVKADQQLCINDNITISAWIKIDNSSAGGHIVSNRQMQGDVNYQLAYNVSQFKNKIQFLRYDKDRKRVLPDRSELEVNQWHLLTVSHDNQTVKFYVDGELFDEKGLKFKAPPVIADLLIGSDRTETETFTGIIGEIAIFNAILSDNEIREMYINGLP